MGRTSSRIFVSTRPEKRAGDDAVWDRAETALRAVLDEEGLAHVADIPVQRLSAGQQRRVALARTAFSRSRKLWILDEPFSSLDNAASRRFSARLSSHAGDGGMVVYTTHQDIPIDTPTRVLELA